MRASSPLHPMDVSSTPSASAGSQPADTGSSSSFLASMDVGLDGLLRRSASSEWRDWEETLDSFSASGLVDAGLEMDLSGLDQFLLATADDFLEPFADVNAAPDSPICAADADFFYHQEQDLSVLHAAGMDAQLDGLLECKVEPHIAQKSVQRHRKRKTGELHRLRGEADRVAGENLHVEKRMKLAQMHQTTQSKRDVAANGQAQKLFRRRYDILHGILEAWNTGGIEDLEEIADNVYDDDVTLVSPDYSNGLHGVKAVMSHWNTLLDAFPDGIMEEYVIQREENSSEKMTASWVFSGTQIYPIHGVQPRHKKVCISGKSFFWFNGDKIRHVVLSWNYRETLMKLMGVQPDISTGIMLSTPAFPGSLNSLTPTAQTRGVRP